MKKDNETTIKNNLRVALTRQFPMALFTNPVGKAWAGKYVGRQGDETILRHARPIDFGLFVGSPDQIGWIPVKITPEMVGKTIAVFVGIELKDAKGKLSPQQAHFLARLKRDGAICGVARSVDDAIKIMEAPIGV